MVHQARKLRKQRPYEPASSRNLDVEQLLGRQNKRVLVAYGRDVVEAVEVRKDLVVGFVLGEFLGSSVEESDVRAHAAYDLFLNCGFVWVWLIGG